MLSIFAGALMPVHSTRLGRLCVAAGSFLLATFAGCSSFSSGDEPAEPAPSTTSSPRARPSVVVSTPDGGPAVLRTVIPGIAGEPDVKIRILESASTAAVSTGVRTLWVTTSTDPRRGAARVFAPVEVKITDAGWVLTDPSGLVAKFPRNSSLAFAGEEGVIGAPAAEQRSPTNGSPLAAGGAARPVNVPAGTGSTLYVNGKAYSGTVQFFARSESPRTFDVIETLPIEEYLKGVVSAEMYNGWPAETYRAQAIAARSYALHERARRRAMGASFDLDGSAAKDQAYSGAGVNPLAAQGVIDTRGVVLTWTGGVLRAYYSSTCGGRAASARDAWPTDGANGFNLAGPLQAQPREFACQNANLFRWSMTRSRADLATRLRAFGKGRRLPIAALTGVESIRPAGVNTAGRANKFLIIQPGGQSYTIGAEDLRAAVNATVPGLPAVTSQTRLNSSDFDAVATGAGITFTGRGFGHGVGLCQHCAKGFAEKGETWGTMLERFYPGAKAERAY